MGLENFGSLKAQPQSTFERLTASAARLVRIRPVGDVVGDDPLSVVARTEAALARGSVADAASALSKLPEPARGLAQPFIAEAKVRTDGVTAAQSILSESLSRLSKPKS